MRAFYDRCAPITDVEAHYNFLQEYVAGRRASMFTASEQESFRNMALSMFPEGPKTREDHQTVVARWKLFNKPRQSPCPFSGETSGLALDHDHETLQLKGFLSPGVNLVIDRAAATSREIYIRCFENLQSHKRSRPNNQSTWTPFRGSWSTW